MNWNPFRRTRPIASAASTLAKHGAAQRRANRDEMTDRLRMAVRGGYVARLRSRDEVVADIAKANTMRASMGMPLIGGEA